MKVIDKQLFDETFQYFDKEIVVEIIDIFLNEYNDRLNTIKSGIDNNDFKIIKFHSHSLKGVVSNFAAPTVQAIAKLLEEKGTNEETDNLISDFNELKLQTIQLAEDLREVRPTYV